jgi:hypothetical protein
MSEPVSQRIVPGAPPPAPLSKSQKKKRKAKKPTDSTPESPTLLDLSSAAPPAEKAPESVETREDSIAPEPSTQPESLATPATEEDLLLKHSPIVELVTKRLKATTKKIARRFSLVQVRNSLINFLDADICLRGN